MASLQNDLNGSDDIFQSVALAMQESLKWKWIAITRFVDPERLEVLTFLENGQLLDNYEYDLIGTPCKTVMDTVKFTFFKDVVKAFPNYKALQSLGVKTYAGLVFKNSEGTPIGHVMAMHESDSVNIAHTQHVFEVATLTLSAHFKLSDANIKLAHARKQALLDQLTHVGNRLAFDTKLEAISMLNQRRKSDDFSVAVIDLDKLKPLNDTYGHEAGDRFIQLMAKGLEGLGRANDEVFRLGGDEFAIVFSQNIEPIRSSIEKRFQVLESKVSKALGFSIGASVGFAALSETKGNVKACLKLADERMYINKQKKKQLY
jgi:diguanylate cyclase (GGDEF)-like protein